MVDTPAKHESRYVSTHTDGGSSGWIIAGVTPSPLLGPAGNREFFFLLGREGEGIDDRALDAAVETGATTRLGAGPVEGR